MATKTVAAPIRYPNPLNTENVLYKSIPQSDSLSSHESGKEPGTVLETKSSGHSTRTARSISEEALRQYLESKDSPLQLYSEQVLASPYWSTIIGICTIEEYSCSVNPHGSNNLWGIMCPANHGICRYDSLGAGIDAIDRFLERAEARHPTVESLNGWYCVNQNFPGNLCPSWTQTVLRVKHELEQL